MRRYSRIFETTYSVADRIAQCFGLPEFSIGRIILRDDRGWKSGEFEIMAAWVATLHPSFSDPIYLLSIAAGKERKGEAIHWPERRIILSHVDRNDNSIRQLKYLDNPENANLPTSALSALPWGAQDWHLTLDGTIYTLSFESMPFAANLFFANPENQALQALVEFLRSTAEMVDRDGISANH